MPRWKGPGKVPATARSTAKKASVNDLASSFSCLFFSPHHHSRCAHRTPCNTSTTSHLQALPAAILLKLYSAVEYTYRGSCHRIYCRSVPESRYPNHSVIDIIVDCFSVNHELPVFLFNVSVLIMKCLLFYLMYLYFY